MCSPSQNCVPGDHIDGGRKIGVGGGLGSVEWAVNYALHQTLETTGKTNINY